MVDMDTLADRVRAERKRLGLTQLALSKRAGLKSKQAVSAIERGETLNPEHDTMVGLSKALGVSADWLKKGIGERIAAEDATATAPNSANHRVNDHLPALEVAAGETPPGYVRLPLLNMEGDMGYGSYSDDPLEVVRFLDVADWWARQNLPKNLDRVKIISSRGDSMAGVINHGDVVFVDTGTSHFEGEGLYVFNWQGRALIKRLAPNLRNGRLQIQSANPAYPPEDISAEEIDELHIAGRVAAWWTLRHF